MTPNAASPDDPSVGGESTAGAAENKLMKGTDLSAEDEFYYAWGRESLKNNLTFANEVLRGLVALMSLLLGGSAAFLDGAVLATGFKVPVLLSFFLALILAFLGMMPYEGKVLLNSPAAIKLHKERALSSKRRYIWSAGAFLAIGFCIAGVGIIAKLS